MKRKILFTVSCIGVFSIGAIIYADLAFSNTTSMLSDQEMAESFGKMCKDCTLGKDDIYEECLEGKCPPCEDWYQCFMATYPSGEYVYNCESPFVLDGCCWDIGLVDCKRYHKCDILGGWNSNKHCDGHCKNPASDHGCCDCVQGAPVGDMEQKMSRMCVCC